jgi:hypothetical protein
VSCLPANHPPQVHTVSTALNTEFLDLVLVVLQLYLKRRTATPFLSNVTECAL